MQWTIFSSVLFCSNLRLTYLKGQAQDQDHSEFDKKKLRHCTLTHILKFSYLFPPLFFCHHSLPLTIPPTILPYTLPLPLPTYLLLLPTHTPHLSTITHPLLPLYIPPTITHLPTYQPILSYHCHVTPTALPSQPPYTTFPTTTLLSTSFEVNTLFRSLTVCVASYTPPLTQPPL